MLNRPKGQPLFHDLERQGVHSLSDQDFWSRVLEMIHGHGMDHYEQSNDEDDDMRDEV